MRGKFYMYSFDVFGGCVSRDLFTISSKPGELYNYFARSSLVSQFSSPLNISSSKVILNSNFQKKMVLSDLNSLFLSYLKKNYLADFIVFDFLVERFKIFRVNDSIYTYSNEYKKSGLNLKGNLIDRVEHLKLFENTIIELKPYLSNYKKVFLNKFYHAIFYKDVNNAICQFENSDFIKSENLFLEKLYDIFESHIDNLIIINTNDFIASETHKWGLATYHFEDGFYENVNLKISENIRKTIKNF